MDMKMKENIRSTRGKNWKCKCGFLHRNNETGP